MPKSHGAATDSFEHLQWQLELDRAKCLAVAEQDSMLLHVGSSSADNPALRRSEWTQPPSALNVHGWHGCKCSSSSSTPPPPPPLATQGSDICSHQQDSCGLIPPVLTLLASTLHPLELLSGALLSGLLSLLPTRITSQEARLLQNWAVSEVKALHRRCDAVAYGLGLA